VARHSAGGRQRVRPGSGGGRAALPGAAWGGLPFRQPAYSHRAAAAILFDLEIGKPNVHPSLAMGEAAAAAATTDAVKEGCVGAGTGATVGKLFGMKQAMKSGIGSFTVTLPGGVLVSSLVAVNAFGDVRDPDSGKTVAGARQGPRQPGVRRHGGADARGELGSLQSSHTTLAVVATKCPADQGAGQQAGAIRQPGDGPHHFTR